MVVRPGDLEQKLSEEDNKNLAAAEKEIDAYLQINYEPWKEMIIDLTKYASKHTGKLSFRVRAKLAELYSIAGWNVRFDEGHEQREGHWSRIHIKKFEKQYYDPRDDDCMMK